MSTPTTENSTKTPKRKRTLFRSCLALFAGFGAVLILFWAFFFFWIGPNIVGKSIETNGANFFRDMKSSLDEKYGWTVVTTHKTYIGKDYCFRVDISTYGEEAPQPMEIAREIYQLKKQSEFMSEEVLIVTINGDREDHGIRFVFPGKNGYQATYKPSLFSAVSRRP